MREREIKISKAVNAREKQERKRNGF